MLGQNAKASAINTAREPRKEPFFTGYGTSHGSD
jgi:hypothetical protein